MSHAPSSHQQQSKSLPKKQHRASAPQHAASMAQRPHPLYSLLTSPRHAKESRPLAPPHQRLTLPHDWELPRQATTLLPACLKLIRSPHRQALGEARDRQKERAGPLFMFHDSTGVVEHFRNMSPRLDRVCYGVQLVDEAPLSSLSELAAYYAREIHAFYPSGPVLVGGYSLGVKIAALAAKELEALGRKISGIVCVEDSIAVDPTYAAVDDRELVVDAMLNLLVKPDAASRAELAQLLRSCADRAHLREALLAVPDAEYSAILQPLAQRRRTAVGKQLAQSLGAIAAAMCRRAFVSDTLHDLQLNCPALLIRSTLEKRKAFARMANLHGQGRDDAVEGACQEERHLVISEDYGIRNNVTGPVHVVVLDAEHHNMFQPSNAKTIACYISAFLHQ